MDTADVGEVALALACNMQHFEKIDVVTLAETDLERIGVETQETAGNTPVKELRTRHVDMLRLDLDRLARLAKVLAPGIRCSTSVFTFTRKDLITLVRNAVAANRVLPQDLNEKLREQL